MNDKHKLFADNYIQTGNVVQSYRKVYPNANENGGRTNGYRLLQKVEIKAYITAEQDRIRRIATDQLIEGVREQEMGRIMSVSAKRAILHTIAIDGKIDSFDEEGNITSTKKAQIFDRLRAIEIDNRMAGDNKETNCGKKLPDGEEQEQDIQLVFLTVKKDELADYEKNN